MIFRKERNNKNPHTQDRTISYVVSLLAGSFLFLLALLVWSGYKDFLAFEQRQKETTASIVDTVSYHLAKQVREKIYLSALMVEGEANDLSLAASEPNNEMLIKQLIDQLGAYEADREAYLILDRDGAVLNDFGYEFEAEELAYTKSILLGSPQFPVVYSYFSQNSYHVYTAVVWFGLAPGSGGYFVVKDSAQRFLGLLLQNLSVSDTDIYLYDTLSDTTMFQPRLSRAQGEVESEVVTLEVVDGKKIRPEESEPVENSSFVIFGEYKPQAMRDFIIDTVSQAMALLFFYVVISAFLMSLFWREAKKHRVLDSSRTEILMRTQSILAAIGDAVIVTDMDGTVNYSNEVADREFGGANSLRGRDIKSIFPENEVIRLLQESSLIADEKTYIPRCDMVVMQNGYREYYELKSGVLNETEQDKKGIVWSLRNVTSNRQTLAELDSSQHRYKTIFSGSGVALAVVDFSAVSETIDKLGRDFSEEASDQLILGMSELAAVLDRANVIELNDAAKTLFAAQNKEQLFGEILKLKANQTPLGKLLVKAMLMGKARVEVEVTAETLTGKELQLWVSATISDQHGYYNQQHYDYVLISMLNITERRRMERAIIEREAFWSKIIEASPDIVYVTEVDEQELIYINRSISQLLGYSSKIEEESDFLGEIMHSEDFQFYNQYRKRLQDLTEGDQLETVFRLKDVEGGWRYFRNRDTVLTLDEKGTVAQHVGVLHEITKEKQIQLAIEESERRFRLLANNTRDVIWTSGADLVINFVSPSVELQVGYSSEEVMGKGLDFIVPSEQLREIGRLAKSLMLSDYDASASSVLEMEVTHKSGYPVWVEIQFSQLIDDKNSVTGIIAVSRNITERKLAQKELLLTAAVFENSAESIFITSSKGKVIRVNESFCRITGFSREDIIGYPVSKFESDLVAGEENKTIRKKLVLEGSWQGELFYRNHLGESLPCWSSFTVLRDDHGQVENYVGMFIDTSEQKASEERIQYLAYYDALTGLPNRSLFQDRLKTALTHSERSHNSVGLLFLDLDRFKPINDSFGHPVGDQLLKLVAKRLQSCIHEDDTVARMGGDEFAIVLNDLPDPDHVVNVISTICERILNAIAEPFMLGGKEVFTTASVGAVIYPQDGVDSTELIKRVDTAMYHAKNDGKNNFQFYAEEMNVQAMERLVLENALHRALDNQEFEVFYQPQFEAASRKMSGMEALIRWQRPEEGLYPPGKFIPLAEEIGLIVPMGAWVLEEACQQWVQWQKEGYDVGRLSVNLSGRQFKDENLLESIVQIIESTGMDPCQLELELTESILMDDVAFTEQLLNEIKSMGVNVSVDDFGTGYSSLNYLKQFPIDSLKIDKSFIQTLPSDGEDKQIALAIIGIAHSMNLGVVAEGVETEGQLAFLAEHDCDIVQGFLFSGPMSAEGFQRFLLDMDPGMRRESLQ